MAQVQLDPSLLQQCTDKTVLITGAARGIGAATAALFNSHGANVVLADLDRFRDTEESLINTQMTHPERAIFVPGNIVDWAELTQCFKTTVTNFGGIHIVVANAGIMESQPVLDLDSVDENDDLRENEEAERVIDVNLKGTLNNIIEQALRLALHYMKQPPDAEQSLKSILLVGSTSSYFGGTGMTAYVASKHGVLGLLRASQSAAREHSVRVNAIALFLTPTHITAGFSQRWDEAGLEKNTPEKVADAIAQVALDKTQRGNCVMVAGKYLRELELTRSKLLPTWLGEDVAEFMGRAMQFLTSIGGYVLPGKY